MQNTLEQHDIARSLRQQASRACLNAMSKPATSRTFRYVANCFKQAADASFAAGDEIGGNHCKDMAAIWSAMADKAKDRNEQLNRI